MMATARLRPQMMRLTVAAADRIKSVMANAGRPIVGVRVGVGVKNGGYAGMAYTMEYAEKVEPSDEVEAALETHAGEPTCLSAVGELDPENETVG